MENLNNIKKITKGILLNEIFNLFNLWIEKKMIFKRDDLINLFKLLFDGDPRYFRYCPEIIEKDIMILDKVIKEFADSEKKEILTFINSCIVIYTYEMIDKKEKNINIDKLYYSAAISQYYVEKTILHSMETNKFKNFRLEFSQISSLISKFYNTNTVEEKNTVADIIKGKTSELFKRFDFSYYMPLCSNK